MTRRLRHIVVWLLLAMALLGAAADGTGRLKNYDIWKDLPSETLIDMAYRFRASCKADSALVCFNIVANRYYTNHDQPPKELSFAADALDQLGTIYTHEFVNYEKAHEYLLQAEKLAKTIHDKTTLSSVYNNLGNLHLIKCTFKNDGKLDGRTLQLYKQAFETALEANHPRQILFSAGNMAHVADDSTNMEVLRNDIELFLNYPIPDNLKKYDYIKDYCQAMIEMYEGNYEKAELLLDKAYKNAYRKDSLNYNITRLDILNNKYHLYFLQGQDQKALDILQGYIDYGKAHHEHQLLYIAYYTLSDYYHNTKHDSILGDRYELLALREKNIAQDQNKLLDAEKTEFLFQIDEINAEVQELTYRQRLMKIIAWCIAAVVLLILGFLYLLWRKYKQEQEKNRKLYENNLALLAAEDERRQQVIKAGEHKYQSHQMEEGEQSDLLHRIFYIMETSEEVYQENFSLDRLTQLVDVKSPNYVSQVLNEHYDHTFKEMLNDYRIREACRRINDRDHYSQLTVQAIAESVGFGSYPNFVTNFKKFTGLTPSAYRKQGKDKSGPHADNAD